MPVFHVLATTSRVALKHADAAARSDAFGGGQRIPFRCEAAFMLQVVEGVDHLHNAVGIVHANLKLKTVGARQQGGDVVQSLTWAWPTPFMTT